MAESPGEYTVSGDPALELALKIDGAVRRVRPDGWRGAQAREQVIKAALYGMRRESVATLQVRHLDGEWGLRNVFVKGGKTRDIPLPSAVRSSCPPTSS